MVKTKRAVRSTASVVKPVTHHHLRVFSRHPSTKGIRNNILIKGKKVVYRHGSTTEGTNFRYEINPVESVRKSADKQLMKQAFDQAGISHAPWIKMNTAGSADFKKWLAKVKFGESFLIIKNRWGSRGRGNTLVRNQSELDKFITAHRGGLDSYIAEEYKTYTMEYRIHVSNRGYFYTCRKALKKDTPKEKRFQRHDDNCAWLLETNPDFNKPKNWSAIVEDCVKAMRTMRGDVFAFDVKTTNPTKSKDGTVKWIIIESCSAPAFGDVMTAAYKKELPLIIQNKYGL